PIPCACVTYFFEPSGDRRDLHSVPTRRSSDLKWDKQHIDILSARFVLQPDRFDVVVASNLFGDILSDLGPACTGTIGIAPSANLDRKSTRLNSSHVKISYAVFCLKKKNESCQCRPVLGLAQLLCRTHQLTSVNALERVYMRHSLYRLIVRRHLYCLRTQRSDILQC